MRLITLTLTLLLTACQSPPGDSHDAAAPSTQARVELDVWSDSLDRIDACAADLALMDGNQYGVHVAECHDGVAVYLVDRSSLPRDVYLLDWQDRTVGPYFRVTDDDRLAVRMPPGWEMP